ncbi:potassium ABC transporter ATPase [Trinickia symbiotica]
MDFVYMVGIAVFLGLTIALAAGCEKLRSRAPGGRP